MNIALAIQHIYPHAVPNVDFVVQDDGPTPVLREGADQGVRYPLRPLDFDETEEVEGVHYRYNVNYNHLVLGVDYDIVNRGPYISVWNMDEPKPTESELLTAWEEISALHPPVKLTESESLKLALAEMALAQAEHMNSLQLALAEIAALLPGGDV